MAADTLVFHPRRGGIDNTAAAGPRPWHGPSDRSGAIDTIRSVQASCAPVLGAVAERADFRPGERLVVVFGAIAAGAMAGLVVLLTLGPTAPQVRLAAALAVFGCAVYLIWLSLREVVRTRRADGIALFALHVCALLAWPLLAAQLPPMSWQLWLGLPLSLAALAAFLGLKHVPISVTYRSSLHASLIAGIAVFAHMSRILGA
jgi:hypothetical protein